MIEIDHNTSLQGVPKKMSPRFVCIRMAARSPDLNPLDFFCWGFVKSKVFTVGGRPQSMRDLKNKITMVVNQLDSNMISRAVFDVRNRAQRVIEANGGYIEKK